LLPRSYFLSKLSREAIVKEATEEDFAKIWDVYRKVLGEGLYTPRVRGETCSTKYDAPLGEDKEESRFPMLICEVDGNVVGYATLEDSIWDISRHVGELGIAVLHEFRGIGIGSALMDSLVSLASEKRYEKITLSVFHTNKQAINTYKKFGFKKVGEKKKQFKLNGQYVDEIIMEKFIG
jgi:ribosomal protein S18 acetylase RimI-like enzyme